MGKFINTNYYENQNTIVGMNEDLIKNPFYLFNDKKGTRVTYYNINLEKTTLDPGSKLAYDEIGKDSPIRFNKIDNFYLYQFNKYEMNLDNGDFGLEANQFTGDSYILPNTIKPTEGDFFEVQHIKDSTWLFKIIEVDKDTLENGCNVYKITWQLDRTTNHDILNNIVDEFEYIDVVEGSNLKSVVKKTKYITAKKLDELSITLCNYFNELFYSEFVQTFIYKWYNECRMYDPFAIEFIIRNNILANTDNFVYVQHQCPIPNTFSIDYNKTFWRAIELKDKERLGQSVITSYANHIDYSVGIFKTRYEPYFRLNYKTYPNCDKFIAPMEIPVFEENLLQAILNNDMTGLNGYRRIIVKFFNNEDLLEDDIKDFDRLDLEESKECFYLLIILIFVIDSYITKLLG